MTWFPKKIFFEKVITLLGALALSLCLAQRGQRRRGQEGRGEDAGQASPPQGTQEGEDFREEGQEGPSEQGSSEHVRSTN